MLEAPQSDLRIELQLRGGHRFTVHLPAACEQLSVIREWQKGHVTDPRCIQIPLVSGHESLTVNSCDIVAAAFPNKGEHPAMNISEGHLGGYISASHPRAVEFGLKNGDPATYSPNLWRWLVDVLGVESVIDVGCGEGHAAAFFADMGCLVQGVDGSFSALRDSVIPGRHVRHDFLNGPYVPERNYDLAWSCEFVEHVDERFMEHYFQTFDSASRYLLMTAAPPGQPGWHHVNCQPSEYWIKHIEPRGFRFDEALTEEARTLAGSGHFAAQGLVFTRVSWPWAETGRSA